MGCRSGEFAWVFDVVKEVPRLTKSKQPDAGESLTVKNFWPIRMWGSGRNHHARSAWWHRVAISDSACR